ncbi:hypothetical protein HDU79_010076 [Rhizoclosmatium sp. JEL0117]|nr:hypothetical protein HDU79_010076 [Rhizoclosmatium sp. JEL0117]
MIARVLFAPVFALVFAFAHFVQADFAQVNVYGQPLTVCAPGTGFFRNGTCATDPVTDGGVHTVCGVITTAFLQDQLSNGNDLITPHPEITFPGLKDGDRWCVCAQRWKQALFQGAGIKAVLSATHIKTLEIVGMSLDAFKDFGI